MVTVIPEDKAAAVETVVRAAAGRGNAFAVLFFRSIRGLPRARKNTILGRLTLDLLTFASEVARVTIQPPAQAQEVGDEQEQPNQLG